MKGDKTNKEDLFNLIWEEGHRARKKRINSGTDYPDKISYPVLDHMDSK